MKPKRILFVIAAIILLSILSVACSKGQATTPAQNPISTQEPGASTPQPVVATSAPGGIAEDVPIMPDAYDLQVPNELNVIYKVDLQIKDVVAFYQQELPTKGWDQPANPDSVVGSMAQMARTKPNGDRITFSIQYNPVGEFTIVQIYLTRAP
jgi:hypothetical protein